MKRMYRRLGAALLALAMMLAMAPALAAEETRGSCGENVTWEYQAATKTLKLTGSGPMQDYTEQNFTPWKPFAAQIERLDIGEGITSIGDYAFTFLTKLAALDVPAGIAEIGDGAFGWCSALKSVALPEGLAKIGSRAFVWCAGLEGVTLPASLADIAPDAFLWCNSFAAFSIAEGNNAYAVVDGVLFNASKTELTAYPAGKPDASYAVPAGVSKIADSAFFAAKYLEQVTLGTDVGQIGKNTFFECASLKDVAFNKGLAAIGDSAFYGCAKLTRLYLPDGLAAIGEYAFKNCTGITDLYIPQSVTSLHPSAFDGAGSMIVKGANGSAAQKLAQQRNLPFYTVAKVFLKGAELEFDTQPIVVNGSTLVPMRKIFESLGAQVSWDNDTRTATGVKGGVTVSVQIGSQVLYKNGNAIALNTPAMLLGGRTLAPLRAVSEAFDINVRWDGATYSVYLD